MSISIREVMTKDPITLDSGATIVEAARAMKDSDVGNVIVLENGKICGMVTDRDITIRCVAEGKDPSSTRVEEFAGDKPVTIGADDSIGLAITTMADHQVRRLPVIDGHDLIGIVSIGDIAKHADQDDVGRLLELISSAPPNN